MEKIDPNFLNGISEEYKPDKDIKDYEPRPTVRVFVLDDKNNIALVKMPSSGMFFPPGGGWNNDEDMQGAVRREVSEEMGIKCEFVKEIGILEHYHENWMKYFIIHHVYATTSRQELKVDYEEYDTNLEKLWINVLDYIKMLDDYIQNKKPDDVWAKSVRYFLDKLITTDLKC